VPGNLGSSSRGPGRLRTVGSLYFPKTSETPGARAARAPFRVYAGKSLGKESRARPRPLQFCGILAQGGAAQSRGSPSLPLPHPISGDPGDRGWPGLLGNIPGVPAWVAWLFWIHLVGVL
jgi:hypothetical protein